MIKKITLLIVPIFVAVFLVLTSALVLNFVIVHGQQGAQTFSANLEGSANKSNSTGTANFQVDENNSKFSYWLNVTGIKKINQAHIHNGTSGQSGDIIVSLLTKSISAKGKTLPPEIGFSGNITKGMLQGPLKGKNITDLADLMSNGGAYVNIHTDKYPKGAIRGQITTTGTSENGATLPDNGAPPSQNNGNATTTLTEQPTNMSTDANASAQLQNSTQ